MNLDNAIVKGAVKIFGKASLKLKQHAPIILVTGGVIGIVTSTVLACRATLKVHDISEEHHSNVNLINTAWQKVEDGHISEEDYSELDKKRDLSVVYIQTGMRYVKLYAPAITLGIFSIGSIICGYGILQKRNVALMAAYKTLETGFREYRKRVVEELGEEKDYIFKNNLKVEEVTESIKGEDGKTKKVKSKKYTANPDGASIYARFFDECSSQWTKTPEYNLMFLKSQQNYFNQMLRIRGHVFLNEVYDALGFNRTQAGALVGWVDGQGDGFVDFGIFNDDTDNVRSFINGNEASILLDFNVDGIIYDLFTNETE